MVTFIQDNLVFYCCLSKNEQQLSQSSFFSFSFPPSLRYNITHSCNLDFYLGITHLQKKNNIISSFMLQERPLSLKLIFHYYNQINRQWELYEWGMHLLIFFVFFFYSLFHFTVFVAGLFLFLVFFFFFPFFLLLFFQHVAFLFFFFSLFLFTSVCSSVCCSFFLVCFLFTSFNFSIFLCPFRLCRVVMLKTVFYGNQVRSESLKNSAGTGTKSHILYTHKINMLIYTCTCSCCIITTQ